MPENSKPPIVIYCICDAVGQASLSVGYLGDKGRARWCFPDEQMASGGFEVQPNELKPLSELTKLEADREVYLFQRAAPHFQQHGAQPPRGH